MGGERLLLSSPEVDVKGVLGNVAPDDEKQKLPLLLSRSSFDIARCSSRWLDKREHFITE
jgi:hypothetical protein